MKKIGFVLLGIFLVSVFFVSGCIQQKPSEGPVTATGGLSTSFAPGAPPSEVGEDGVFDISVVLENKGEALVPAGKAKVFLRGLYTSSFEGLDPSSKATGPEEDLDPVQLLGQQTIPGGTVALDWSNLKYLVDVFADTNLNFVAQTCYQYETKSEFEACLSASAYAQATGAETCKVQGEKPVRNSIAPVKLLSVQENPAGPKKFSLILQIANIGKGQVYDYKSANAGTNGVDCVNLIRQDLDKVYVDSIKLGEIELLGGGTGKKITCPGLRTTDDGKKYLVLTDGAAQLTCTLDYSGETEFTGEFSETLRVKFSYGYTEQISHKLTIQNIPGVVPKPSETEAPAADTTPPIRSNPQVNGLNALTAVSLPAGTRSIEVSLTTDETATCKLDFNDMTYDDMRYPFSVSGSTSHSTSFSVQPASGAIQTAYVRCMDVVGNKNTEAFKIQYSIPS